jgi:hypothetical protein
MVGANGMGLGAVAGRHPLGTERRSGSAVVESGCTVVLNVATGFTSTRAANVRARNP